MADGPIPGAPVQYRYRPNNIRRPATRAEPEPELQAYMDTVRGILADEDTRRRTMQTSTYANENAHSLEVAGTIDPRLLELSQSRVGYLPPRDTQPQGYSGVIDPRLLGYPQPQEYSGVIDPRLLGDPQPQDYSGVIDPRLLGYPQPREYSGVIDPHLLGHPQPQGYSGVIDPRLLGDPQPHQGCLPPQGSYPVKPSLPGGFRPHEDVHRPEDEPLFSRNTIRAILTKKRSTPIMMDHVLERKTRLISDRHAQTEAITSEDRHNVSLPHADTHTFTPTLPPYLWMSIIWQVKTIDPPTRTQHVAQQFRAWTTRVLQKMRYDEVNREDEERKKAFNRVAGIMLGGSRVVTTQGSAASSSEDHRHRGNGNGNGSVRECDIDGRAGNLWNQGRAQQEEEGDGESDVNGDSDEDEESEEDGEYEMDDEYEVDGESDVDGEYELDEEYQADGTYKANSEDEARRDSVM